MASEGINLEVSPISSVCLWFYRSFPYLTLQPKAKPVARVPVVKQLSEEEKEKQRKRREEDMERRKQMRAFIQRERETNQDKGNFLLHEFPTNN